VKKLQGANWDVALIWDTGDHQHGLNNGFFGEQGPIPIEQVVNIKRREFVNGSAHHHGLNVMLDTIAFSHHRYSFHDFMISLGLVGFQFLMSAIRGERHRIDKLIGQTELNWNNISKELLIKLDLVESQIISSPKIKGSSAKKLKLENNMVGDNPFNDQNDGSQDDGYYNLNEESGDSFRTRYFYC